MVVLSNDYPLVTVPFNIKKEAEYDASKGKRGPVLFRGLMGGILGDDKIWSATNGEGMFKNNKDLVLACIGK
jgi:hypothetical protein